jgi:predicted AlkP superfamily phosphohydrolase/phosphomutase
VVETRSFESFSEFRAAETVGPAHQVVIIGVDGATWNWLDPLIEEGHLPNFERLKREGAYGTLMSGECYVSPPAWTSINTGYSPAKSGVFTFGSWHGDTQRFSSVTAADVDVPSIWDVASAAAKKVAVVNVPFTYPVRKVNGVMVTGLLTPVTIEPPVEVVASTHYADVKLDDVAIAGVRSFSPPRKTVAMDSLNTFLWFRIDSTDDGKTDYGRVVLQVVPNEVAARGGLQGEAVVFDIGDYSPWVELVVERDGEPTDAWCKFMLFAREDGKFQARISQTFFDPRARSTFTHPPELADELMEQFDYYLPSKFLPYDIVANIARECGRYASHLYDRDDWDLFYYVFTQSDNIQHHEGFTSRTRRVYAEIDRLLGEVMDKLPEESTLMVVSDHGFDAFHTGVDLNEHLEAEGLLVRADGDAIDHDRTLVFHNMWNLYFNHSLLSRQDLSEYGVSIAAGESAEDALAGHLEKVCANIVDDLGRSSPVSLATYGETADPDDPDMVVKGSYDRGYLVEFWNIKRARGKVTWQLADTEQHHHLREGVVLMWGAGVKKGAKLPTAKVEDIAPTALYLLGAPWRRN